MEAGEKINNPKKEEGPARGDLVRPTRREFRCLLFGDLAPTAFWGKAVANWEGTTFAALNNRISHLNCQPFVNDFHGERAKKAQ